MSLTYRALALLLSYPTEAGRALLPAASEVVSADLRIPGPIRRALVRLCADLAGADLYEAQERYVWLFDRTRSLSLNLYEHVHGESRDRGQAMVALLELYRAKGLELSANELPDHLPVFLEFLSTLPDDEAASLLGEGAHVLHALGERLHKRQSPYRAVFGALAALSADGADAEALTALMAEPDDNPDDLEAMDKLWAETAVTFGPSEVGCPKADALVKAMQTAPAPRRVRPAA
ncbi:MAG: nitrate reductase molybdenum cofactor assembly chaperone [Phenylobacterium sp.]|uniref:nitrate reductase molybdenum cofactor assembly chaperone n=1 Tax=Phenylobacterium sp. TaxID=1871053 RepID=UPI0025CF07D3|nr:nitrate reductase molybdenum cofactor assembly chaperone [Phenylobacterium sp.]MBI1197936.1 nitrate reductase molybdenum cofactor assembly chaperone [Phenylobacterium sp.]